MRLSSLIGYALRWSFHLAAPVMLTCCAKPHQYLFVPCEAPLKLMSIHIVDRNGLAETISNPDRVAEYACVDFLKPQPYKKVLRIFSRDSCGNIRSLITSYYENGQVQKYLEVNNNRAFGTYREWYESGAIHLEVKVIGGVADITTGAENTWLFDGEGKVWDECGNLSALIQYQKGQLHGESVYYHPNGELWKRMCYISGKQEGSSDIFYKDGKLLQTTLYSRDEKDGPSTRYWHSGVLAAEESYSCGKLLEGKYYDQAGTCLCCVKNGDGQKAVFSANGVREYHTYFNGVEDGEVRLLADDGTLVKTWAIRNGEKHGPETEYFPTPGLGQRAMPKLEINWYEGKIQGLVKTWYPNGIQESQREMANNAKNGLLTAWYRDGSLMLVEEYLDDKLQKGEYYRRGEPYAASEVDNGEGIATLFDPEGTFLKKVNYRHGTPYE